MIKIVVLSDTELKLECPAGLIMQGHSSEEGTELIISEGRSKEDDSVQN